MNAIDPVEPGQRTVRTPQVAALRERPLRILLVEDSEHDATLLLRELRRGGYQPVWTRVDTAVEMRAALATQTWDAVISDHEMPQFSGPEALAVLRETRLDLPFIIVSGAIGEDAAVAAMKAGAHDYVMKDRLARLVPALERELQEAVVRRQRKRAERNTRLLLEVASDTSGMLDLAELLRRAAVRTVDVLPCDAVAMFYWDSRREVFRVTAHHGVPAEMIPAIEALAFPAETQFGGRIANGQTAVINNFAALPWVAGQAFGRFPITALVAAPLQVGGRQRGALVAASMRADDGFGQEQVDLCSGIAQQLSVATEAAELYGEQQEQAEVAGAIAQVGQALISMLHSPAVLEELCRLTTEVLQCDCSHTFLWKEEKNVFVLASGYGDTPEQAEALRILEVPESIVAGLVAGLETQSVLQAVMSEPQNLIPAALPRSFGISAAMYVALRRAGKIIGIQTACFRDRHQRFTPQQERIGAGIAELASMSLENARLIERLERADRLKSEFVATMSHELRTPLNIILGYVELLLDEVFGPLSAEQLDTLRRTQLSARQLHDLIEATLDISRLESGRLPPQLERVSPTALVRELAGSMEAMWCKPDVEIAWDLAAELPEIRTDPVKLRVILRNLIDNAVKFTEHGRVTVSAAVAPNGVEVSVRDTGVGIAPEALAIVFEPFRQADNSDSRLFGGAGLGLYTVRLLVDLLGGTIHVETEVASGSCFRVWMPLDGDTNRASAT